MAVYASLLSSIPMPQQNWKTKSALPSAASIKVGDVTDSAGVKGFDDSVSQNEILERLKNYFVQKRLKKLESIPPEKRTAVQKAEIEANKLSVNCMV